MSSSSHALTHRGFRVLWVGSLFAFTAQWVQQVSVSWVGFEITGSAALLGLILGVRAIPMLLLAPLSGVAVDRFDRKRLLTITQIADGVASIAIAALLFLSLLRPWHLVVFVFITGVAGILERNVRHAMVRDVVPPAAIVNAVALNNIGFSAARIIAPAVAGMLLVWAGAAGNFLLLGLTYFVVSVSLIPLALAKHPGAAAGGSAWLHLKDGLRFSWRNPSVRVLMASGVIQYFFLIPAWATLLPVFAKNMWHVGPEGLGLLFTAVGLGGFLGGLLGAIASRFDRLGVVSLGALALFSASLFAVGLSPSLNAALPVVLLAGIGEMLNATANQTLVQLVAPDAMRGRVTSLVAVFPAFISLGAIPVGLLAEAFGPGRTAMVLGTTAGLICAGFWIASRRLREMRVSHYRH